VEEAHLKEVQEEKAVQDPQGHQAEEVDLDDPSLLPLLKEDQI